MLVRYYNKVVLILHRCSGITALMQFQCINAMVLVHVIFWMPKCGSFGNCVFYKHISMIDDCRIFKCGIVNVLLLQCNSVCVFWYYWIDACAWVLHCDGVNISIHWCNWIIALIHWNYYIISALTPLYHSTTTVLFVVYQICCFLLWFRSINVYVLRSRELCGQTH